jgi:superfamily II DNA or RNA helicase
MSEIVTMYKSGNVLYLEPTTQKMIDLLEPKLSFVENYQYYGPERARRSRQSQPLSEVIRHTLMDFDYKKRIVTPFGFWKLVRDSLRENGYEVKFKDLTPIDPKVLEPVWDNIQQYSLRENQPEFIQKILLNRCGRFNCPPGFGKSFMIGIIAALFPNARIDVVSQRVSVLRDRIYPELVQMVGDVGIFGGGKKKGKGRVMCYTARSMKYSPATADILIGDECHALAADNAAAQLVRWQNSRNYGLSATHNMRMDNKDFRMHGVFGPIIFSVDYQSAQNAQMVVPLKVFWRNIYMDRDPAANEIDLIKKKRYCIWTNEHRNQIIANDARKYDEGTQVLIIVETIEHAMNLKKLLPEFTLVYMDNGLSWDAKQKYIKLKCIEQTEPEMTTNRKMQLTTEFENGSLKKVICTTVWNEGVSFNQLNVLIRADAGGSNIGNTQIPGRVSRISDGKSYGIVHDYVDEFNHSFKAKSRNRAKAYETHKWEQITLKD